MHISIIILDSRSGHNRYSQVIKYLVDTRDDLQNKRINIGEKQQSACEQMGWTSWASYFLLIFTTFYTSVELLGLFLPRRWARNEAPTGSNAGLGLAFIALNVADNAPYKI